MSEASTTAIANAPSVMTPAGSPAGAAAQPAPGAPPAGAAPASAPAGADDLAVKAREEATRREGELRGKADAKAASQLKTLLEAAKTDPLKALEALGLSEDAVLDRLIASNRGGGDEAGGEPAIPKELTDRLAQLEASQQATIVENAKTQIRAKVSGAGDKYPRLAALDKAGFPQHNEIYRRMADEYAESGSIPDPLEVAAKVEKHWEGVAKALVAAEQGTSSHGHEASAMGRTLSNRSAGGGGNGAADPLAHLHGEARMAALIARRTGAPR